MDRNDALSVLAWLDSLTAQIGSIRRMIEPLSIEPPKRLDPRKPDGLFVVRETIVQAGDRVARVAIDLAEPLLRQVEIDVSTLNGSAYSGTSKNAFYRPLRTRLVWRPGQIRNYVEITLNRDLADKTFDVVVSHTHNYPTLPDAKGTVRQGAVRSALSPVVEPVHEPARGREGRTLYLLDDFMSGKPWDRKAGTFQATNKEIAVYVTAQSHPGFDPHPIEVVDGVKRCILRMIRQNVTITKDGREQTFPYRAPMLDSQAFYMCETGDYLELDVAIPADVAGIPAFWLMSPGGVEYCEDDIFEFNLKANPGKMACSAHYVDENGEIVAENCGIDFTPDGRMNTFGYERGRIWCITTIDGREVHRRRNLFPDQALRVKINNTAGGIGPDPKWALGQTEDMVLGQLRVYR